MSDVVGQPWFWPVLAVVVGLPIALLVLTEVQSALARRGNPSAKIISLLRNLVLPSLAILILVVEVRTAVGSTDLTWQQIVATVFGFLVILLVLNSVNLVLFTNARPGSWRDRLPSIFIDIGRLLLIVVGLAILFSIVWGTDVGGLFTALGVTSIVIGLALQGAVGSVVSGLLLLFEQPFRLGDWLDSGGVRGRVIEVNWRAVHIDTGNGIQIVPNASLAGASFTNLSQAPSYAVTTAVVFTTDDPPTQVCALLERVARNLPELSPGSTPTAVPLGGANYELTFELPSPAVEGQALAKFRGWLWYAARRAGLALDGDTTDAFVTVDNTVAALNQVAPLLKLTEEDVAALTTVVRLERFAAGEVVVHAGSVPEAMRFVLRGTVDLAIPIDDDLLPVTRVESGDYLAQTAITREPLRTTAVAATDVALLVVPVESIDDVLRHNPRLARELGKVIDRRQSEEADALAGAGPAALL